MDTPLPDYRGTLAPASWSRIVLSDRVKQILAHHAIQTCPYCSGKGYQEPDAAGAVLCPCTSRPSQA